MRGDDEWSGVLFSYIDLEARVWRDHPLRVIREIANAALASLAQDFVALYPGSGVPRSHQSSCSGLCCCRRSIRSVRSGR